MDSTRLTQLGTWPAPSPPAAPPSTSAPPPPRHQGSLVGHPPGRRAHTRRTRRRAPQIFFLWAPLKLDDGCMHFLVFEEPDGERWVGSQAGCRSRRRRPLRARHGRHTTRPGRARGALGAGAAPCTGRHLVAPRRPHHRARAAAHVPHARHRLHAPRVGPRPLARRAGRARRGAGSRPSSTTSTRRTSTCSRSCAPPGATRSAWGSWSSSPSAPTTRAASTASSTATRLTPPPPGTVFWVRLVGPGPRQTHPERAGGVRPPRRGWRTGRRTA